jgi:hypothetical protein
MKILHKIMPLGINEIFTNVWTTIVIPSYTSNTSTQFLNSMQNAHTLYMDLNNLVFVQIKFKLLTSRYFYIHSFPMLMGYIHGS